MTVNTTKITSGPYIGNGIADTFSYTFRVADKTQLSVFETDDNGVETLLTVDTDYTVSGIGVDQGGTITRTAGALPTDYEWYIRSNYQKTQLTAFQSQGAFFPDLHENAIDQLTFLIQQVCDAVDRSPRLSDSYSGLLPLSLPDPEAGKLLFWKTDLTGFENGGVPGAVTPENSELTVLGMIANTSLTAGLTVLTQGYTNPSDGGNATYIIKTTSQASTDGDVIDGYGNHTLANGLAAILQDGGRIHPVQWGIDVTGTILADAQYAAMRDRANILKLAVDIDGADILLSVDAELPRRGTNGQGSIRGAKMTITRNRIDFQQKGLLLLDELLISGAQYVKFENVRCTNGMTLDGNAPDYGVFWCEFGQSEGQVNIDLTKGQSVNQNVWHNHRGGVHIFGQDPTFPVGTLDECDSNKFVMIDSTGADITATDGSTGWHILNESRRNQVNIIECWYAEGSGKRSIRGAFHVLRSYSDGSGSPYALPQDSQVMFTGNNNLRNTGDFLAGSPHNNGALGGSWDLLNADDDGQPLCYSESNVVQSVSVDATEPSGLGFKYGGTSVVEFASLNVELPVSIIGRCNVFIWIQVVQGTISLQYNNNGSPFSFDSTVYHDGGNDWRLYRLSGAVRTDGINDKLEVLFRVGGGTGEVHLGTCWATPEKTAFLPNPVPEEDRIGVTVDGVVNTIPTALPIGGVIENRDVAITFGDVRSWQKVSASVLSAVVDELPFVKTFGSTVAVTGTTVTTLATVTENVFNGSTSGWIEIFWSNPQGSPDFNGAVGWQKYTFSMLADGDSAAFYEDIQLVGESWSQRGGGTTPPVITILQSGNTWQIRAQVVAGIGDSTAYVKVQLHDITNGFSLS